MVKISAKIDRAAYVRKDTVQIIDTNISKSNPYYKRKYRSIYFWNGFSNTTIKKLF